MKPFDPSKPVQTRDGRKARIICTDRYHETFPIVALVMGVGVEHEQCYTSDGRFINVIGENRADLINIPAEFSFERWANVYDNGFCLHDTREKADKAALTGRRACIVVTVKGREGDGLQ